MAKIKTQIKMWRQRRDEERLLEALSMLRVRVEAGLSFTQSLTDLPELYIDSQICSQWKGLRERITHGRIGASSALGSLLSSLEFKNDVEALRSQKSLSAKLQAGACVLTSLLFIVAAFMFFPAQLRASPSLLGLSLSLIGLATFWMWKLQKRFMKSLWFADWILLLEQWHSCMSWGQTFATALNDSQQLSSMLPLELKKELDAVTTDIKRGKEPYWPASKKKHNDAFAGLARDQAGQLLRLYRQQIPLSEMLLSFARSSQKLYKRQVKKKAEILSWQMMMPLLFCVVPALLLLLFGPLLSALSNH